MNENLLISVIIPVYNVENFLHDCLNSVISQTYTNLEIILVDDGSTDKSGEICDEFATQDNRIKVIHKQNGGLSSARNAGLDIARGRYVSFVDSDDIIDQDFIKILFDLVNKYNTAIAMCGYKNFTKKEQIEEILQSNLKISKDEKLNQESIFEKNLNRDLFFGIGIWKALYSKEIWANLRFPMGKIYEDVAIWFDIFNYSPTAVTYKNLYFYRVREGSIVNSFSKKHLVIVENVRKYTNSVARAYPKLAKKAIASQCNNALNTAFNIIRANKADEFKNEIDELHKFVRKNLNLTYFLIPNKAYKIVMMILFYISPKLLKAFYKAVKAVR
ncbi:MULTISPECIES: glycosyltransferase [unclassified Campylobacter]|uniref:glycosyltransferase n=1 Tax=unclassified Campylobacter TaxID=2593542 RepID=UPI0022E9E5CA|nr:MULTISPECIES: glycosyltransferase [unclassified Campylobacter]MDA3042879.1 glycosyltransferase [Campylobacter sp. JMF_09 ED2]MDA3044286.1 glycosyltransferase [Campylobacter sp. JMF_07 ED4]MDA3063635.1 glycosyltransferase [Campylobacter sp. JMF_11 EL3]MDA3071261.1 glycosyltransferase [Campylobacter sp. VBCF_03 NA9]MDA3074721.1 glycosyltransferase [Campylobacter sp. JMF_05 ED3]